MFYTNAFTGQILTLMTEGASSDTVLYLLDASGNLLDVDDDGGEGLNSRIVYRATSSGIVFVKVRPHEGLASGTCQLRLTRQKHPDLVVLRDPLSGSVRGSSLFVSTRVANTGDGPLDFSITTWQTFFAGILIDEGFNLRQVHDRTGAPLFIHDVFLNGDFANNRWKWPGFMTYRLRNVGLHGAVGSVRATSQVNSWLVRDSFAYDLTLPGAPSIAVRTHTRDTGGLSVGW